MLCVCTSSTQWRGSLCTTSMYYPLKRSLLLKGKTMRADFVFIKLYPSILCFNVLKNWNTNSCRFQWIIKRIHAMIIQHKNRQSLAPPQSLPVYLCKDNHDLDWKQHRITSIHLLSDFICAKLCLWDLSMLHVGVVFQYCYYVVFHCVNISHNLLTLLMNILISKFWVLRNNATM